MNLDDYIDIAIRRNGLKSDRDLDRALGFKGNGVVFWRSKRSWPSDKAMMKLAVLAGVDPEAALLDLNLWRAKSPEVKAMYSAIAAKLKSTAAALALGVLLLAPQGTEGARITAGASHSISYAILAWLRRLTGPGPLPDAAPSR